MNEKVEQIPLGQIRPNPWNRKHGGFNQAKLQELAESIRVVGVLHPALVRFNPVSPHADEPNELVAGERRWKAARLAGLATLPCVVREIDDATLMKIATIENLQREDIHPLDEAEGYARLIAKGDYDVELLAKEVGRSPSYIYQRLKLQDLIPPAKKQLEEGKIEASHAILIARLQPAQQKEILGCFLFQRGEEISVREIDVYIRQHILLDLSQSSFKRDDAELVPAAGPCTTCPKRTGYQPALFADVCNGGKKDYCTDPLCFHGKLEALLQRRRQELKGQKHLEVLDRGAYGLDWKEQQRLKKAGVKESSAWEECKKSDEDAVPALVVAGDNPGRLTYGRERKQNRFGYSEPTAAEKAARKKQLLEAKIQMAIRKRTWDAVLQVLEAKKVFKAIPAELLRTIAQNLWQRTLNDVQGAYCQAMGWKELPRQSGEYGHPWERMGRTRIAKYESDELLQFMLTVTLAQDLIGPGWHGTECQRMKEVAAIYKLDTDAIAAQVRKEFTEKAKAREERAKKAAKPKAKKRTPAKKPRAKKAEASQ
jgi:ParB family chromosome partitioning protein